MMVAPGEYFLGAFLCAILNTWQILKFSDAMVFFAYVLFTNVFKKKGKKHEWKKGR